MSTICHPISFALFCNLPTCHYIHLSFMTTRYHKSKIYCKLGCGAWLGLCPLACSFETTIWFQRRIISSKKKLYFTGIIVIHHTDRPWITDIVHANVPTLYFKPFLILFKIIRVAVCMVGLFISHWVIQMSNMLSLQVFSECECCLSLLKMQLLHFLMFSINACLCVGKHWSVAPSDSTNIVEVVVGRTKLMLVVAKCNFTVEDTTAWVPKCDSIADNDLTFSCSIIKIMLTSYQYNIWNVLSNWTMTHMHLSQ